MTSDSLKQGNVISNSLGTVSEEMEDLEGRYSSELTFIEKYCKGWSAVILNFHVSRWGIDDISRSGLCTSELKSKVDVLGANMIVVFNRHPRKISPRDDWYQKPVFVGIAELVKTANVTIPSLVRFYLVDNYVGSLWAEQLDVTLRKGGNDIFPCFSKGKINPVGLTTETRNNFNSNEVECGSKIVDRIANDDGNIIRSFGASEFEEIISCIEIFIDTDPKRITLKPFGKARLKLLEMSFGSLDF